MTSPADELRAEARTLWDLAYAATTRGDGHWFARCDFPAADFPAPIWRTRARLWTTRWKQILSADAHKSDAQAYVDHRVGVYIAAMNPAVGVALTELLTRAARHHDEQQPCCQGTDGVFTCPVVAPALDLVAVLRKARAITAEGGPK